jgi:hypothetical protein
MVPLAFAQKVWISICNYALHSDFYVLHSDFNVAAQAYFNVSLSPDIIGAKGLKSFDRSFAEFILSPIISGPMLRRQRVVMIVFRISERMCEKYGHISYVMLRNVATKHLGRGNLHYPRFFAPLRMTFHTPLNKMTGSYPESA